MTHAANSLSDTLPPSRLAMPATGLVQPQLPCDLREGLLVECDGIGAPVDVLVGPPEADEVGGDDAVAARGEQRDDAVEGLRPERLTVQADNHLQGKTRWKPSNGPAAEATGNN